MNLVAYDVSLELQKQLKILVPQIAKHDPDLAKQIRKAGGSITMNLGEGVRQTAGNQRSRYESAHGSANEVKAGRDVAMAWVFIERPERAMAILDRQLALLWGLTHPKRSRT